MTTAPTSSSPTAATASCGSARVAASPRPPSTTTSRRRRSNRLESDLDDLATTEIVSVRGFDAKVDDYLEANKDDEVLATALSEHRLVKDDFEIAQLQLAVDYTVKGFEDVVRALPGRRRSRRTRHRGRLPPARARRGQRHRLRHDRRQRLERDGAALDAEHR